MWQGCDRSVLTLLLLSVVGVSSGEGVVGVWPLSFNVLTSAGVF